jgi:VIT1/CCC1 family predicted Fe2+/Mn2+ transporter
MDLIPAGLKKTITAAYIIAVVVSLLTLLGLMQEVQALPIVLGVVIRAIRLIALRMGVRQRRRVLQAVARENIGTHQ